MEFTAVKTLKIPKFSHLARIVAFLLQFSSSLFLIIWQKIAGFRPARRGSKRPIDGLPVDFHIWEFYDPIVSLYGGEQEEEGFPIIRQSSAIISKAAAWQAPRVINTGVEPT